MRYASGCVSLSVLRIESTIRLPSHPGTMFAPVPCAWPLSAGERPRRRPAHQNLYRPVPPHGTDLNIFHLSCNRDTLKPPRPTADLECWSRPRRCCRGDTAICAPLVCAICSAVQTSARHSSRGGSTAPAWITLFVNWMEIPTNCRFSHLRKTQSGDVQGLANACHTPKMMIFLSQKTTTHGDMTTTLFSRSAGP